MMLEIDKGLVMSLPEKGERYGIENLKVVAAYSGRVAGKIRKYAKDGKLTLLEGIGVYRLTKNAIKAGKGIDYDAIRLEFKDLNRVEVAELEQIAVLEHESVINGIESDSGNDIIHDFLDLGSAVMDFLTKRTSKIQA